MKRDYLRVPAWTGSEWDSVDSLLIPIDDAIIAEWEGLVGQLNTTDFDSASINDDSPEFVILGDDEPEGMAILSFTDEELEALGRPEGAIRYGSFRFYKYGGICYKAYNKHTNEEFWCESFNVEQVRELLKKSKL